MSNNRIIIGYSGHAFVLCDIITSNGRALIGYCETEGKENNPYQLPYLGKEGSLSLGDYQLVLGIGDNQIRERVFDSISKRHTFANVIHQTAHFGNQVDLGVGITICANANINPLATIGNGVICNTGSIIEHECKISDFVHIAPGAVLAGNVTVGRRSFIGANSTIIQGVSIGNDVIVGAGSVIINDVPDNCVVVGNPGKIIKQNS